MKKILLIVVILLSSCQSNKFDGIWVGHYNRLDVNDKVVLDPLHAILKFEKSRLYTYLLEEEKSIESGRFIKIEDEIVPLEDTTVGLKVKVIDNNTLEMVHAKMGNSVFRFKRYDGNRHIEKVHLKGHTYRHLKTGRTYTFFADGMLLRDSESIGTWKLLSVFSTTVLEVKEPHKTRFLMVDSIQKGKIYFTDYSRAIEKIVLEEICCTF